MAKEGSAETTIRDIKRMTRCKYNAEEKIRIVIEGLRGEESIAELCRREGIAESLYYSRSKEFMETCAAFLTDPTHRIVFHYTPKHASWINQVEIWFSILVRKLLKRGNFTSTHDLKAHVLAFNRTMAKPFKWAYKGKALAV